MASKNKKLRSGYTTGACAAAAAKAATMILLSGKSVNRLIGKSQNKQSPPIHPFTHSPIYREIEIPFPDGSRHKFKIQDSRFKDGIAAASTIKDAGDDPDVTNGAEIRAEARIINNMVRQSNGETEIFAHSPIHPFTYSPVIIRGGKGVGKVTKPGLQVPVGESAINPVPRKMIKEAVMEVISEFGESEGGDCPRFTGAAVESGLSQTPAVPFGLTENEITHSRGLITKDEVRAVTIHKLRLPQRGVLWDIGAGSGSVSVETARLYPEIKVLAVEKDEEQIKNIKENRIKFDALNIEIIKGRAPDVLINLPAPHRVFIGGSGGKLKEIIDLIAKMQTAIIVINAATVETLNIAVAELQRNGFLVDVSQVSVSRMKKIGEGNCFSALNPIFVIKGEKS